VRGRQLVESKEMRWSGLALVLLLIAASPPQDTTFFFDGPDGAGDDALQRAARAVVARCEASSIKGLTFTLVKVEGSRDKRLRFTGPAGFTPSMRETVRYLASIACSKVELRFINWLGQAEAQKYRPQDPAPKGSSWARFYCWTTTNAPVARLIRDAGTETLLLKDKPIIDAGGKYTVLHHNGGDYGGEKLDAGVYLEFTPEVTKSLKDGIIKNPDDPKKTMLPVVLFIDGIKVPSESGMMRWISKVDRESKKGPLCAVWNVEYVSDATVLPLLLRIPMPFSLKPVE